MLTVLRVSMRFEGKKVKSLFFKKVLDLGRPTFAPGRRLMDAVRVQR